MSKLHSDDESQSRNVLPDIAIQRKVSGLPSPENIDDFDKELAFMQLVGYLELAADNITAVRKQLDELSEAMKNIANPEGRDNE